LILTLRHTIWVLIFCLLGVILSVTAMILSDYLPEEKWEPKITEPSVIVVIPLDSPNGCYSQYFWSKVE
jgi:hypothetical protein